MPSFGDALSEGLRLAERLDSGSKSKNGPPSPQQMQYAKKGDTRERPSAPMVFAIVTDSTIVGNPDVIDYQPEMYGGDIPSALIPLQMSKIGLEIQCLFNNALITVTGSWRLHCIKNGRFSDCFLAIPLHEQGTMLSMEIEMEGKLYVTQPIPVNAVSGKTKPEGYASYSPYLFSLRIPKVRAGGVISIKVTWLQVIPVSDGCYVVSVPFVFPTYVLPSNKSLSEIANISLSVNVAAQREISAESFSHPMKETFRQLGKAIYSHVETGMWMNSDFVATYKILSNSIWSSLLIQENTRLGSNQQGTFCLFLSPPGSALAQAYSRVIVFLMDKSGSMHGKALDHATEAISSALSKLSTMDCFNIIAFDQECVPFSSHLQFATPDAIQNAKDWISQNCQAHGGTNILKPLNQAFDMLRKADVAIPQIFLITDGAVEDELDICQTVHSLVSNKGSKHPRISTFGIGPHCNHYFLRMLALTGKGTYESAFSKDLIRPRIERMILATSVPLLSGISLDISGHHEEYEVYPCPIPDLYVGSPLTILGKFNGKPPEYIKIYGTLPDMTASVLQVDVQKAGQMPLEQIFAKHLLDLLTAQAWFTSNNLLKEQVIGISLSTGLPCEYTQMVAFETDEKKYNMLLQQKRKEGKADVHKYLLTKMSKVVTLGGFSLGFGSVSATIANSSFGGEEEVLSQLIGDYDKTMCCQISCSDCCSSCDIGPCGDCSSCCGSETTGTCSRMWDNCAILCVQSCIAATSLGCWEICSRCCCCCPG